MLVLGSDGSFSFCICFSIRAIDGDWMNGEKSAMFIFIPGENGKGDGENADFPKEEFAFGVGTGEVTRKAGDLGNGE